MNQAIGIDIGGTKIAVGAVDDKGAVLARAEFATESAAGFDHAKKRIVSAIDQIATQAGWRREELCGIGIGCTGPVNPKRGTIHNPYTLPGWDGCDIVTPLNKVFGVPVYLENDADAAVLGEAFAGAARDCADLVMLTFGTGIGTGILVDGRIYRGVQDEHPEMGHIPVESGGAECYCGRKGCFESVASGSAIAEAGRANNFRDSQHVFAAAGQGNAAAQKLVDHAVRATGTAAWTILHTFLPQRILLGGGIIDDHYELFASPIREAIAAATMVPRQHITVAKAQLGNVAGLVGAASLALRATR
ncbi:MAG: ROK family protein [Verrucomicrobia bacterium]|nr:ROK family protein [Verrucomicrobiota bacterium]